MEEIRENLDNQDTTKKRILIYDDNIEILNICKLFLSKFHYQLQTMPKCEDVVNDVKNFKPHFILMDLWIPLIGGEKAVELLKKDSSTSNIPVILFSANADIKEICKRVKADGYIAKPFNLLELKEKIETHIQNSETN